MINIFDGVQAAKNTKWVKSDFVVMGNNGRRASGVNYTLSGVTDPGTKADLEKAIRDVETSASRGILEYDKLIRELDAQRKSIKEMITEYKATSKLADLAILVKTDADVIANKIRVVEAKRKLDGERLKHLREERKLAQGKGTGTDTGTGANNVNIINQSNGALGVAQAVKDNMAMTGAQPGVVTITPEMLGMLNTHKPVSMIENNSTSTIPAVPIPTKQPEEVATTLGDKGFDNAPNPDLISTGDKEQDNILSNIMTPADFDGSDTVVRSNALGTDTVTVSDVQKEQNERIAARLANKDAVLHVDTMMNYDYSKSLDALTTKTIPQKEKYYINPYTGEYWRSVIEVDDNGNEIGEIMNAPKRSITHIGSLTCNPKHRTVIAYYYPEPAEYVLVDQNTPMPKFYQDEWSLAKNSKFRLTEDQCNELLG